MSATEEGSRLLELLRTGYREVLAEALSGWDRDDVRMIADMLGRLGDALASVSSPARTVRGQVTS